MLHSLLMSPSLLFGSVHFFHILPARFPFPIFLQRSSSSATINQGKDGFLLVVVSLAFSKGYLILAHNMRQTANFFQEQIFRWQVFQLGCVEKGTFNSLWVTKG